MTKRILSALSVSFALILISGCGAGTGTPVTGTNVDGTWTVIRYLSTDAVVGNFQFGPDQEGVNSTGGAGMRAGDPAPAEQWVIKTADGQYSLTSAAGTITGQLNANGVIVFYIKYQDPTLLSLGINNYVEIYIYLLQNANGIYGGEEIKTYVANGLGQIQPIPQTEAWWFEGTQN